MVFHKNLDWDKIGHEFKCQSDTVTEEQNETSRQDEATKTDPFHKTVYVQIPCECGSYYIWETGKPLGVRIKEHKNNLNEG
jgi:hypothetical protein